MLPTTIVAALLIGLWAPASQDGKPGVRAARSRLKDYLEQPEVYDSSQDGSAFNDIRDAAERLADDPEARDLLRKAFEERWIKGGGNPKLRLDRFEELAARCPSFGPELSGLVGLLARPDVPVAWGDVEFRRWLRGKLGAIAGGGPVDRLLAAGVPESPTVRADRYAFLLEVVGDAQVGAVRSRFNAEVWPKVKPAAMPGLVGRLEALGAKEDLARFRAGSDPDGPRICRLLANHLYDAGPDHWTDVGEALPGLAAMSSGGLAAFLQRALDPLKVEPKRRTPPQAEVVRRLIKSDAMAPRAVLSALDAGRDLEWFLWTHRQGISTDLLDKDRSSRDEFFRVLLDFDSKGDFPSLFPDVVADFDKRMPEATFKAILSRRAVDPTSARLVLESVRAGGFAGHRTRLGREVMRGRPGLDAAWPGTGAPSRLEIGIEFYTKSLDPRVQTAAALQQHVGEAGERPLADDPALLDEILKSAVAELRGAEAVREPVLGQLGTLIGHLGECRRRGADLTRSRPLRDLEGDVARDVEQSIDLLAKGSDRGDLVARFIDRFKLALRLRRLVQDLGRSPPWIDQAVESLKKNVFKLDDRPGFGSPTWDVATLEIRARQLLTIDVPLRECLTAREERDRVFSGLYLPLARVPGFLKALKAARRDWPHRDWSLKPEGVEERLARFGEIFDALKASGPLDAEDAVLDLAQAHLDTLRGGGTAWEAVPDEVFAGRWGPNADARVWRRMLAAKLPREGGAWRVQPIAARAVDELIAASLSTKTGPAVEEIAWVANLVTAAEWQGHRLRGTDGQDLGLTGRLSPGKRTTAPFDFRLIGDERARAVNGRLRLRLLRSLLDGVADDATPDRVSRLDRLAEVADLLPNDAENDQGPPGSLGEAHELRQRLYAMLDRTLRGEERAAARTRLLRRMMRLNVANRGGISLRPDYGSVVAELRDGPSMGDGLAEVFAEEARLRSLLDADTADNPAAARARIDARLTSLLPQGWKRDEAQFRNIGFLPRLEALDEGLIQQFLQLREDFRTILVAHRDAGVVPADLARVVDMLDLLDAYLWYTRSDFRPEAYLDARRSPLDGKPWWPALVLLAWADSDFQKSALVLCDSAEGPKALDNAVDVRLRIFRLDEAAFVTLHAIRAARRAEVGTMLAFRHAYAYEATNFRLLAEVSREGGTFSAESLARDSFRGALTLLRIAEEDGRKTLPPSDDRVRRRLFEPLGTRLRGELRRPTSRSIGRAMAELDVDTLARLADELAGAGWAPDVLKRAADGFLSRGVADLLTGMETPEGMLKMAAEIGGRCRNGPPGGYRRFYESSLLAPTPGDDDPPRLSDGFTRAMARSFFARDLPAQRTSAERLLASWRLLSAQAAPGSRIEDALRSDFARVFIDLVRGREAEGRPYLWRTVETFLTDPEPLKEPPADFLNLARWWLTLSKPEDPPEFRKLFSLDVPDGRGSKSP